MFCKTVSLEKSAFGRKMTDLLESEASSRQNPL